MPDSTVARTCCRHAAGTLALLVASLVAPATAQTLRLPWGDAYTLHRGPSVTFTLLVAQDGSQATRLRVDEQTPGVTATVLRISGGSTLRMVAPVPRLTQTGTFPITVEVDLLGPDNSRAYETIVRASGLPGDLAITSLGLELEFLDQDGEQTLLTPTFSGGEFVEPGSSIPLGRPIDTRFAHCAQASAYYGDDGTGLLVFALDRAGTKPKHFLFESGRTMGGANTLRLALEYWLPNGNVGGAPRVTPVRTKIAPYSFLPSLATGWYRAAQVYRQWLEANARGSGGILESGRLETRSDVPKWMKETDLLISEQFGWYPQSSVPNPLLNLTRLTAELGASNALLALWFWTDRSSANGRTGGYYPLASTAAQLKTLRAAGIRATGYTLPAGFDVKCPLLATSGLAAHAVQDRALQNVLFPAGLDSDNSPILLLGIDLAAPATADWYSSLAALHTQQNGMSGFYVDAPVTAGDEDWQRLTGQEVGTSEAGFKGLVDVIRHMQAGARSVGQDLVVHHEAAFEWLVRCAGAGQGAAGVLGRAYHDEPRTRGVPFFQAVFSGYTLFWPADEGLGTQTLVFVPDAYGDFADNNMTRLLAEGFTWGGMPNHSEILLGTGQLYYELVRDWSPEDAMRKSFLLHKSLLTRLIGLRKQARPWLVYGRMLESPVAGGDSVQVKVKQLFDGEFYDETFTKRKVPTTAWQASDGSIRLVAANGSADPGTVLLDLRRIGLFTTRTLAEVGGSRVWTMNSSTRQFTIKLDGGTAVLLTPK